MSTWPTREQMAQQIASEVAGKGMWEKFSIPQVTAILVRGGRFNELFEMANTVWRMESKSSGE